MIIRPECQKRGCKHFIGVTDDGSEMSQRVVCKAFPFGIPDEIAYGTNKHIEPVEGDNGIQYEREKRKQ